MSKTKMGSYKYDRRFNDNVLRGNYSRNKTKSVLKGRSRGNQVYKNIVTVGLISFLILTWFMVWSNNRTTKENLVVEASGTCPVDFSVLDESEPDGKGGFQSADPASRDAVARDGRRGDLFDKYFGKDAKIARAVCQSESGMQDIRSHKMNKNGTYDWGRCQINEIHAWRVGGDIQKLLDPETNVKTAYDVFRDNKGFTPWTDYKNGNYEKYLGGK